MSRSANALLVLGMHRSGTSATSGALERLGFALGGRLVPAADDNPKGYFEHEAVVAQHERFLEALGRGWADPRPMDDGAWECEIADEVRRAIASLVREDFDGRDRWAIKDPRLSRLLPLWRPLWAPWDVRPHALLVLRRPSEVAGSLARRNRFPPALADWLWVRHTLEALSASAEMPLACLDYGALLDGPARALGRALEDLGLSADGLDDALFAGFVDPGMNHHAYRPADRSAAVSRLADEVYEACIASPRGPSPSLRAAFHARALDCWSADGPLLEAGMAPYRGLVAERAALRESSYALRSAYVAQVRWSDDASVEMTRLRERIEQLEVESDESRRVEEAMRRDLAFAESIARARELERDDLLVQRAEAAARHDAVLRERQALSSERDALAAELKNVLDSSSWRLTRPLRWLAGRIRKVT